MSDTLFRLRPLRWWMDGNYGSSGETWHADTVVGMYWIHRVDDAWFWGQRLTDVPGRMKSYVDRDHGFLTNGESFEQCKQRVEENVLWSIRAYVEEVASFVS